MGSVEASWRAHAFGSSAAVNKRRMASERDGFSGWASRQASRSAACASVRRSCTDTGNSLPGGRPPRPFAVTGIDAGIVSCLQQTPLLVHVRQERPDKASAHLVEPNHRASKRRTAQWLSMQISHVESSPRESRLLSRLRLLKGWRAAQRPNVISSNRDLRPAPFGQSFDAVFLGACASGA